MSDDETNLTSTPSWLKRLSNALGKNPKTREELLDLLRDMQHDLLDPDSLRMIEGVLQVSQMTVSEIMLPRAEMVVVQKDSSYEQILPIAIKSGHSRIPVIGENKDEVIGILMVKDLLIFSLEGEDKFSLKDILRPAVFVPENKRLNMLLNEFRKNRNHIAIVVDEYGGVTGLVSIEDILEQIVGDIEDEHDVEKDVYIRQHKDDTYSIKAITPIEDFNRFFGTTLKDDEYDTIGGLVLQGFGHLPKRGETIMVEEIPFKVLRANNRRIQVLQTKLTPIEK